MNAPASRPRRSVMYVPAINQKAMAKVKTLDADAIVFDLEDAVAPAMKAQARANLAQVFAAGGFGARETVIRVNALGTPDIDDDLRTVAQCAPDAVLLPKVSSVADLKAFREAASRHGVSAGTGLWAMVETAAALLDLDAIVAAGLAGTPQLQCLVVGTNDIAKETGVFPGDGRQYLVPWLMGVVLVAKHRGVPVLDGVWNDFGDTAGFDAEAAQSVKMAFDGKTLIHPSQVEPANRAFSPTDAALAQARDIAAAFELPEHAGAGVINLNGKMVERLHLEQATRLLAIDAAIRARAQAGG